MRVQTFLAELAVECFDERIACGLSGSAEVQNNISVIGPQIHIPRDKFRPIVHTNGFWVADFVANPIKGFDYILTAIAELHIENGHIS